MEKRNTMVRKNGSIPVVLTIAGSDSGGGAGIQADLKTFSAFGVFGTTAITCLTAQNPDRVRGIQPAAPRMVDSQIRAVCEGFTVAAVKTGMLYSAGIIRAAARAVRRHRLPHLVVDPVMVATSGAVLLRRDALHALARDLLPLATVITPNIPEAELLTDREIHSVLDMKIAAEGIGRRFGVACVVKGGHLGGADLVNVLYFDSGAMIEFRHRRVQLPGRTATHGTGCTFSAAIAAGLALGLDLPAAVRRAGGFVARAVAGAVRAGRHRPLNLRIRA